MRMTFSAPLGIKLTKALPEDTHIIEKLVKLRAFVDLHHQSRFRGSIPLIDRRGGPVRRISPPNFFALNYLKW